MSIDKFMLGIGLINSEEEIGEDVKEILIQEAEAFLRAGGILTLDTWRELSPDSKAAFVISGTRLQTETAVRVGMASQSEEMACRIMSDADGGSMEVARALNKVLDYGEARINNKREVSGERLASM